MRANMRRRGKENAGIPDVKSLDTVGIESINERKQPALLTLVITGIRFGRSVIEII